jgi:hypothetical protein
VRASPPSFGDPVVDPAAPAEHGDDGGRAEHLEHEDTQLVVRRQRPDEAGHDGAEDGAGDAYPDGAEEAHRIGPGDDQAAQGADDEATDDDGEDEEEHTCSVTGLTGW